MGNGRKHKLAVLSDEDCWLLFGRRALEHRSAEERLALEKTGREIVKKCGGVPLTAKTIGSVMLMNWWMEKDTIVNLWVAHGFISSNESEEEKIGERHFNDLLSQSLLQDAELHDDKNIRRCKMHDLVHDLAQFVAGSNCSVVEIGKQALSMNINNVHHSLLIFSHEAGDETNEADEMASILATRHKAQKLQTLLIKSTNSWGHHRVSQNLFQRLRCIRALDFESYQHWEIAYISGTGIGRLTGLRTLTNFVVGVGDEECKCEELKHLNYLQGRLQITGLKNVRSRDEAREAELYNMQNLHALFFKYNDDDAELLDDEVKRMEDVLEILQPHTNLKEFEIYDYKVSKLPKWIEDPAFCNLVRVKLWYCDKCKQLPGLGKLPSLKYLEIMNMEEVIKVGGEFRGNDDNEGSDGLVSFPKLETLIFWNMPNLEWELSGGDGEVMPSLLHLTIYDCIKLELPSNLPPLLQKLVLNLSNEGMSSGRLLRILPSLKHLMIAYSLDLTSLPGGWLGQLKALQTLETVSYGRLGSLPEELQQLTMLQELTIRRCPLLEERYRDGREDGTRLLISPISHFI
ncbi:disease resistance protein RGA2-like [Magnolia sinica]|uniref:disease resistance protein RGA2-like n=1 Tax=Magnolia sinica TaxID=86752 RepID=UPI0026597C31|nr:disease resistance protein RGA2-like [Magnolia sinica]